MSYPVTSQITGEGRDPFMPEEMEKAIKETPRDAEVSSLRCQKYTGC